MNAALPRAFAPCRLCSAAALGTAVAIGVLLPMYADVKLLTVAIVTVGLAGLGCLLVLPNRRICLTCAWVFVLPLSLEKIFPIFKSEYPNFRISPLVVSGADVALYLLTAALLLERAVYGRKVFSWSAAITPWALLVAWVCVEFVTVWPTNEGIIQVLHWLKMLLFLVVFSSAIRNREEMLAVLATLAVAVLIQSTIVGVTHVLKRPLSFSPKAAEATLISVPSGEESSITRATGTLGHPNQQGMYQAMFTIPLIGFFMVRNWIWRILAALVVLASLCAIIVTVSRTSWISCALAAATIVLMAWRNGRINRVGWLSLGMATLLGIALVGAFSNLIITRLTKADEGASTSRIHLALLALEHISHYPITGVGPGNYINAKLSESEGVEWTFNAWLPPGRLRANRFIGNMEMGQIEIEHRWYHSSLPAHNKYLLIAAELGLIGLALFLWFQWRLLREILRGMQTKDPLMWWFGAALIGTFVVTLNEYNLELFYDDKTVLMPMFANALMIAFARIAVIDKGGAAA
jgi:O-antigen ligase